ncbi:hypothetical protein H2508_03185 [Parahaliea sp. F7430]|uniref:Peptidoglycan-binding protein CsiV n=1 Tax=Sediminihaliea albiluteola TaxID=2758564 RepID=A0A7W2TUF2_9GAMM|nr:CsiV family protein [Sediminihaliea albiluteola]MBA6412109.1 hypothetical protein [Sediminihaliea albiluteola]
MKRPIYYPQALLLMTLLCCTSLAQAAERWFRVELFVFSQGGAAAAREESWDPEPLLRYPDNYRFLLDPQRIARNKSLHPQAKSQIDSRGLQRITFPEPGDLAAVDIPIIDSPASDDKPLDNGEGGHQELANADQPPAPQLPQAYALRDASELTFRGKAAYMERNGSYRTLFHQTWLQPIVSESQALPIILDHSGDDAAYPALQGSIKLYLSRYLHLETNLWLNTQGDYLSGEWRMPAPPLGPSSVQVVKPAKEILSAEEALSSLSAQEGLEPAAELEQPGDDTDSSPHYPYRHAVLLQQSRRMRSNEVHYIDHPMLGLVVKLTPLTDSDLQQLGAAQSAL